MAVTISIIIPCYCSENTIEKVVNEIRDEFSARKDFHYQIILVNDSSPDNTYSVIEKICERDPQVCGVDLSRNFGQEAARFAGISYVRGEYVVYMDDDGQHPPADIFRLIEKLREGYDVVFADIQGRKGKIYKRITSKLHGRIAEWIGNKPKGINLSSFIACNKIVIEAAQSYHSPFPSIGAYFLCVTTKFANVQTAYRERLEGKSGYNLAKLLSLWLRAFTNFSIIPLRIATFIGTIFAVIGIAVAIFTIINKLVNPAVAAGFTSILASIYLVGGMILILLGLIGEYIGRTYMTVSNKPQYFVRSTIGSSIENDRKEQYDKKA